MYIECPFKFLISVGQCEAVLHIFEPNSKFQLRRGEVTIEDQLPLTSWLQWHYPKGRSENAKLNLRIKRVGMRNCVSLYTRTFDVAWLQGRAINFCAVRSRNSTSHDPNRSAKFARSSSHRLRLWKLKVLNYSIH